MNEWKSSWVWSLWRIRFSKLPHFAQEKRMALKMHGMYSVILCLHKYPFVPFEFICCSTLFVIESSLTIKMFILFHILFILLQCFDVHITISDRGKANVWQLKCSNITQQHTAHNDKHWKQYKTAWIKNHRTKPKTKECFDSNRITEKHRKTTTATTAASLKHSTFAILIHCLVGKLYKSESVSLRLRKKKAELKLSSHLFKFIIF